MHEKRVFERLFDRGGYVLDFTDNTFAEFFREHGINIEEEKYHFNGRSKMKRLRAFWESEPDHVVGKVLQSLLECVEEVKPDEKRKASRIINKLRGESQEQETEKVIENNFLRKEFKDISIHKLNLDSTITEVLEQRMKEIEKCLKSKSSISNNFFMWKYS